MSLMFGLGADKIHHMSEYGDQVQGALFRDYSSSLDTAQIQEFVNQVYESLRSGLSALQKVLLPFVDSPGHSLQQDTDLLLDGRQGRLELVGDHGHELIFHLVHQLHGRDILEHSHRTEDIVFPRPGPGPYGLATTGPSRVCISLSRAVYDSCPEKS